MYDQAISREIVSVGILLESESIKYYTDLMNAAQERDERKFFQSLVKFEEGHKAKLQREYRRLERGASWENG